jgi:hypothetical protein
MIFDTGLNKSFWHIRPGFRAIETQEGQSTQAMGPLDVTETICPDWSHEQIAGLSPSIVFNYLVVSVNYDDLMWHQSLYRDQNQ